MLYAVIHADQTPAVIPEQESAEESDRERQQILHISYHLAMLLPHSGHFQHGTRLAGPILDTVDPDSRPVSPTKSGNPTNEFSSATPGSIVTAHCRHIGAVTLPPRPSPSSAPPPI